MANWVYHTNVTPRPHSGGEGNVYAEEYSRAFDIFLEECKVPRDRVVESLRSAPKHIIMVDTHKDHIDTQSEYPMKFLRSKFLVSNKFRRALFAYYNAMGFYVNGPTQLSPKLWMIDLGHFRKHTP